MPRLQDVLKELKRKPPETIAKGASSGRTALLKETAPDPGRQRRLEALYEHFLGRADKSKYRAGVVAFGNVAEGVGEELGRGRAGNITASEAVTTAETEEAALKSGEREGILDRNLKVAKATSEESGRIATLGLQTSIATSESTDRKSRLGILADELSLTKSSLENQGKTIENTRLRDKATDKYRMGLLEQAGIDSKTNPQLAIQSLEEEKASALSNLVTKHGPAKGPSLFDWDGNEVEESTEAITKIYDDAISNYKAVLSKGGSKGTTKATSKVKAKVSYEEFRKRPNMEGVTQETFNRLFNK